MRKPDGLSAREHRILDSMLFDELRLRGHRRTDAVHASSAMSELYNALESLAALRRDLAELACHSDLRINELNDSLAVLEASALELIEEHHQRVLGGVAH